MNLTLTVSVDLFLFRLQFISYVYAKMTLHESWTVHKVADELVSDGELTSSDFDLDLGSFTNIR